MGVASLSTHTHRRWDPRPSNTSTTGGKASQQNHTSHETMYNHNALNVTYQWRTCRNQLVPWDGARKPSEKQETTGQSTEEQENKKRGETQKETDKSAGTTRKAPGANTNVSSARYLGRRPCLSQLSARETDLAQEIAHDSPAVKVASVFQSLGRSLHGPVGLPGFWVGAHDVHEDPPTGCGDGALSRCWVGAHLGGGGQRLLASRLVPHSGCVD